MIKEILNLIANVILCGSMTMFYIYLYSDRDGKSVMNKWTVTQHWSLRIGLVGIMTGSLFNILTFAEAEWPGVLLNSGLALTFFWAYKFHKYLFHKKAKQL